MSHNPRATINYKVNKEYACAEGNINYYYSRLNFQALKMHFYLTFAPKNHPNITKHPNPPIQKAHFSHLLK